MTLAELPDFGWYAERDCQAPQGQWPWQPVLQLSYYVVTVNDWFETEEACLDFIRTEIVGKGMYDEPVSDELAQLRAEVNRLHALYESGSDTTKGKQ